MRFATGLTVGTILVIAAAASGGAGAQAPIDRIREADLKADLFALAGDAMRGREGGTVDELTASMWIAERAREAGLQPGGDNGTYFQFFPLERFRVSASSPVTLGGKTLRMGRDVLPDNTVLASVDAPVVVAPQPGSGQTQADALAGLALSGKVLVLRYAPPPAAAAASAPTQVAPNRAPALRTWLRGVQQNVASQNPAAIVAIVPEEFADQWRRVAVTFPRGTYALDPAGTAEPRVPARGAPLLYVRESALGGSLAPDARLVATIFTDSFQYPTVNIIAKVPGRDRVLTNEYVLYSAHQDHDGVRYAVNGDDIWNGADDNATTAVALLAIGRAVAASPGRRTSLFIWHGAEERGLMGSRWYVKHPTVPLKSIAAVLNGDMIGRNDPNTAALLGAQGPHRNSPELVDMALAANAAVTRFTIDSSWDDPQHREGWYYRSDHLPYARAGVPAPFFTTLLHPDYHTPFDNPDRIDIAKLARMTRWMYATGRAVAEADKPPAVDPAFKLERCRDSTGDYCGG
jgi:Peptidase family M28